MICYCLVVGCGTPAHPTPPPPPLSWSAHAGFDISSVHCSFCDYALLVKADQNVRFICIYIYIYISPESVSSLWELNNLAPLLNQEWRKQDLYMTGMLNGPPSEALVKSCRVQSRQLTLWCTTVPPPRPLVVLVFQLVIKHWGYKTCLKIIMLIKVKMLPIVGILHLFAW